MAAATPTHAAGRSSASGGSVSPVLGATIGVFFVALTLLVIGRRANRSTGDAAPNRQLVRLSVPLLAIAMVAAGAVSVHTALVPNTDEVTTGSDVAAGAKTTPAASSSDMSGMDMSGDMSGMDMSGHDGGGTGTPPSSDMAGMDMSDTADMPGMDHSAAGTTSGNTSMANMPGMTGMTAGTPTGNSSMAGMTMTTTPSSSSDPMAGMPGMPGMPAPKPTVPGTPPTTMPPMPGMPGMPGMPPPDPAWKYTGPPLPVETVHMINMVQGLTDAGHAMQTPDCSTPQTAAQKAATAKYVADTNAAVAKYKDLNVAKADGYTPITDPHYPVVHYYKNSYLKTEYIFDPNHVQSLVYAITPNGPVLAAAMYIMPFGSGDGPMPYGCGVQWHKHTNLCMSNSLGYYSGFAPCPAGSTLIPTPYMSHVWQVPVPGGQLALDPTDLQVVESAIMSQSAGSAVSGTPGGPSTPVAASNSELLAVAPTSGGGSSKRARP